MSCANRLTPSISLVVRWPLSVPKTTAEQLARQLAEARLASTWAVEEPAQASSLQIARVGGASINTALLIGSTASAAETIDRGLSHFQWAGQQVVAVDVAGQFCRGSVERRLCQAGVRAVITAPVRATSSSIRPLPFGVWEFAPHVSAPPTRRWLGLFGGATAELAGVVEGSPVIASIDMGRLKSPGSREWRAVERLICQAAEAAADGAARVILIAEVAAGLSVASSRPQRSILRAAA